MVKQCMAILCFTAFLLGCGEASVTEEVEPADPYPYRAHIFCSYPGGEVPYWGCMERGLDIRVDGINSYLSMAALMNVPMEWEGNRAIMKLSPQFSMRMINTDRNLVLNLEIYDLDGTLIYQDQAGPYDGICVRRE